MVTYFFICSAFKDYFMLLAIKVCLFFVSIFQILLWSDRFELFFKVLKFVSIHFLLEKITLSRFYPDFSKNLDKNQDKIRIKYGYNLDKTWIKPE